MAGWYLRYSNSLMVCIESLNTRQSYAPGNNLNLNLKNLILETASFKSACSLHQELSFDNLILKVLMEPLFYGLNACHNLINLVYIRVIPF